MADMSKAEKLAAARKKLKEYQQKPKDSNKTFSNVKNTDQNNVLESRNGQDTQYLQQSFNQPVPISHVVEPSDLRRNEVTESFNQRQSPQHHLHYDINNMAFNNTTDSFIKDIVKNDDSNSVNGISYRQAPIEPIPSHILPGANDFFDNLPTQNTDWFSGQSALGLPFPLEQNTTQSNFPPQIGFTESPAANSNEQPVFEHITPDEKPPTLANIALGLSPSENLMEDLDLTRTESQNLRQKLETPEPNHSIENIQSMEQPDDHIDQPDDHIDLGSEKYYPYTNSLPELTIPEEKPSKPDQQQYTMGFIAPENPDFIEERNSEFVSTLMQTLSMEQPNLHLATSPAPVTVKNEPPTKEIFTLIPDIEESHVSKMEHATLVNQQAPVSPRSTAENIRQLSMQMSGLIGDGSHSPIKAERNELESRNQELAALLELERQRSEQLQQHLREYESRLAQGSAETEAARADGEAEGRREVAALHGQLQLHTQTLGILVAEKTELQAALAQLQAAARQKVSDAEELKSRLNASRHRVADLEKEVNTLRTASEQSDLTRQTVSVELEQLKREQALVSLRLQETLEEREEISHRLSTKSSECSAIGQELFEVKSQLSLSQLRVEQLSSHTNPEDTSHLETLYQDKINLEHKVGELELALSSVETKEEEKYKQYQLYVTSMDEQLHGLTECNERLAAENRRLAQREDSLVGHVTGLEKRLQDAMQAPPAAAAADPSTDLRAELHALEGRKAEVEQLLAGKEVAHAALEEAVRERDARIEELESFLDRMQGDQPDQARLLAAMESDKVAASRAVSQNQFLKQELEEIQNKNIQLSDGLFDITDKLQHERHVSRELAQRLTEQEAWIGRLNEELAEKAKGAAPAENHHYDDHGQIADILHRELAQTKDRVEALTQQNAELRALLAQKQSRPADAEDERDEQIRRLTAERDELLAAPNGKDGSEAGVSRYAMERLQERFTSTMREVADLSDEKQRLEHLVLQLQGETETIGEYIALYQKQRSLLRERADEKDSQLKCLAQDREEMRGKLAQLNELIRRLVAERGADATDAVLGGLADIADGRLDELRAQADKAELPAEPEVPTAKADTADEIMALLTEIGSSNLIDPQQLVEHFHPCAWCSGRLITV